MFCLINVVQLLGAALAAVPQVQNLVCSYFAKEARHVRHKCDHKWAMQVS